MGVIFIVLFNLRAKGAQKVDGSSIREIVCIFIHQINGCPVVSPPEYHLTLHSSEWEGILHCRQHLEMWISTIVCNPVKKVI